MFLVSLYGIRVFHDVRKYKKENWTIIVIQSSVWISQRDGQL